MTSGGLGGEEFKQESSWRYPLAIFIATLILCAVFLYYYVGPSMDEIGGNVPNPAISEENVSLQVGDFAATNHVANHRRIDQDFHGGTTLALLGHDQALGDDAAKVQ